MMKKNCGIMAVVFLASLAGGKFYADKAFPERFKRQSIASLVQNFVKASSDFEVASTPVTQAQWFAVMGTNPSLFKDLDACPKDHIVIRGVALCPQSPVDNISWKATQAFLIQLNHATQSHSYSLPTESQWQIAAEAPVSLEKQAWYGDNSSFQTHTVKTKSPNRLGLYDVYGNVFQWTQDHILKGCSWDSFAHECQVSARSQVPQEAGTYYTGLRLIRTSAGKQ